MFYYQKVILHHLLYIFVFTCAFEIHTKNCWMRIEFPTAKCKIVFYFTAHLSLVWILNYRWNEIWFLIYFVPIILRLCYLQKSRKCRLGNQLTHTTHFFVFIFPHFAGFGHILIRFIQRNVNFSKFVFLRLNDVLLIVNLPIERFPS